VKLRAYDWTRSALAFGLIRAEKVLAGIAEPLASASFNRELERATSGEQRQALGDRIWRLRKRSVA